MSLSRSIYFPFVLCVSTAVTYTMLYRHESVLSDFASGLSVSRFPAPGELLRFRSRYHELTKVTEMEVCISPHITVTFRRRGPMSFAGNWKRISSTFHRTTLYRFIGNRVMTIIYRWVMLASG